MLGNSQEQLRAYRRATFARVQLWIRSEAATERCLDAGLHPGGATRDLFNAAHTAIMDNDEAAFLAIVSRNAVHRG